MKIIACSGLLSVLLSVTPAFAQDAAPATAKCHVRRDAGSASVYNGGVALTNGVTAALTNTSPKEITSLTIYGTYSGTLVSDVITKTIPPGATVMWTKAHTQLPYSGPNVACHIKKVVFSDGTSWPK